VAQNIQCPISLLFLPQTSKARGKEAIAVTAGEKPASGTLPPPELLFSGTLPPSGLPSEPSCEACREYKDSFGTLSE
jgi:hypothetical protein